MKIEWTADVIFSKYVRVSSVLQMGAGYEYRLYQNGKDNLYVGRTQT